MGIVGGATSIIGTILAILTFYFSTYLPYINGENTPLTETFTPVLEAIPNARDEHEKNAPPTPPRVATDNDTDGINNDQDCDEAWQQEFCDDDDSTTDDVYVPVSDTCTHSPNDSVILVDADQDGFTITDGDCDDNNPDVNPNATEDPTNGIDDNCNGEIDEVPPDADQDGFTITDGDCDDNNPDVNPNATEDPTNGIDDNCNGEIDEVADSGDDDGGDGGIPTPATPAA
jgi:hypothetical protein